MKNPTKPLLRVTPFLHPSLPGDAAFPYLDTLPTARHKSVVDQREGVPVSSFWHQSQLWLIAGEEFTWITFFPQAYMENFEKCAKRKRKKHFISLHCPMSSVVVFPPLFLNLSLYVILDIPEVPAFKKRAQVFGRWSLYNEWSPFDLKSSDVGRGGRYINNLKNS